MKQGVITSALLVFLLAGCTKRSSPSPTATHPTPHSTVDETPRAGGTLRVMVEAEPPTLNPLVEHDAWTTWIALGAIYEPLVREDGVTGALTPALAIRFDAPDDHTLHFALRQGVSWHDGKPFTIDDVVATFELLRAPGASADQRVDFVDLSSVERTSPSEVTLHFSHPAPLALRGIAHLPILPAHLFNTGVDLDLRRVPASRAPVGTGPFRFVSWRPGEVITLEKNPRYWGDAPHIDRIELRIVGDKEAAWELARRGELDLLWRLAPSQLASPPPTGMHLVTWRLPTYSFVMWNLRQPGLGDPRVRQALTLLTDRARYLKVAFHGRATEVTGPFPLDSPSYDRTIVPWPFDPPRARRLLDEAGVRDRDGDGVREVDGKPFHITLVYPAESRSIEPLATMMQEDFKRAGILLDVAPTEWATMLDQRLRKHAFDAASFQWNMQPVQENYDVFHSSQAASGQNFGGLRDPEVDRLLDQLRRTPLGPARIALDHRLHRRIHDLQPYTFLGCPEIDSLVADRVHGYSPSVNELGLSKLWIAAP